MRVNRLTGDRNPAKNPARPLPEPLVANFGHRRAAAPVGSAVLNRPHTTVDHVPGCLYDAGVPLGRAIPTKLLGTPRSCSVVRGAEPAAVPPVRIGVAPWTVLDVSAGIRRQNDRVGLA
jgi:hypothetical protein